MKDITSCRFLIVDDEEIVMALIGDILLTNGYTSVAYAKSGQEALEKLKKESIDFVIADWVMPKMTGVELLTLVRSNPKYFHLPFIMLTGEMSQEKVIYAIEEGVDDYLGKPFDPEHAIKTIQEVWQKKANPDPFQYRIQKLYGLMLRKRYDEALRLATEILKVTEHPDVLRMAAECYLLRGDPDSAEKCIRKSLQIKQEDSRSLRTLGNVHMERGQYHQAVESFKQATERNPLNTKRKIELADVYLKMNRSEEALEIFESVGKSEPTDLNLIDMGIVHLENGDIERAGLYLNKIQDPIPEAVPVFNNYGVELRRRGKLRKAVEQYKRCLKVKPSDPTILYNLGRAFFELEKFQEAQTVLEKSVRLRPIEKTKKFLTYVKASLEPGEKRLNVRYRTEMRADKAS
jgi:two-component system chemotaxis response regulator CheY